MGSLSFNAGADSAPDGARGFRDRRRNRHGRGLRTPLMLPMLPGARTRGERFEDLVAESGMRLEQLHGTEVAGIDFRIGFVPDRDALDRAAARGEAPPLGQSLRAQASTGSGPTRELKRVIVYRRPVEQLCPSPVVLPELVHDVVVELVAELMNLPPEQVDSTYGRSGLRGGP
ncbi:metallopeptidase family protein [Zhihengliuella flava]|uniref:Metallopeptidase family protein n=1 Tax=Zhihengliuella flava TaxID=1285193 RepID=A0A931GEV2_9MICC|nr:metallopeptidase family protein [Zhihengliuella flava]MBG6083972.1 hypothetical protein [Zhihengliuella flava]